MEENKVRGKRTVTIACRECSKEFQAYISNKRVYCSQHCRSVYQFKKNGDVVTPESRQKQRLVASELGRDRWANSDEYRQKMIDTHTGENSYIWKGEEASYGAKHIWIHRHYGKASLCECCGTKNSSRYEWANLSGEYRRSRDDFAQLCIKCHRSFDRTRKIWEALVEQQVLIGRMAELKLITKDTFDKPTTPENQNDHTWQGGYRFAKNSLKRYKLDRQTTLKAQLKEKDNV